MKRIYLVIIILCIAAFFRFSGVNWDQNQHLHPDERFLTMVATGITWPKNIGEYLDSQTSPLNPHNKSFGFYVYGTFPLFFTKWIAESLKLGDYSGLTIVGRQLSALVDLATVLLVYLIALKIEESRIKKPTTHNPQPTTIFPLLAMFLYAISTLSIQISHFYAMDTFLTFFITLTFYIVTNITESFNKPFGRKHFLLHILLGISFSLALASKISASLFLPIICLGLLLLFIRQKNFFSSLIGFAVFVLTSYFVLRLAQPYLFANPNIFDLALNSKILDNWKELAHYWKPDSGFPPSIQWFYIKPLLFPLQSFLFWGMGLPLGILCVIAVVWMIFVCMRTFFYNPKRKRFFQFSYFITVFSHRSPIVLLSLATLWSVGLFIYQGIQPAPSIRYFHPIYPFLCVIAAFFIYNVLSAKNHRILKLVVGSMLMTSLIWPISFSSIYSRLHSRVLASQWIYQHIPPGSKIATEHWDDGLPLSLEPPFIHEQYTFIEYPLYNQDSPEKWQKMAELISQTDYIALTSDRLWASLTRVPDKYPITNNYYQLLFGGRLGFQKVAEIVSAPSLNIPFVKSCLYVLEPQEAYLHLKSDKGGFFRIDRCDIYNQIQYHGIVFRDEAAEETFTVYDHPKVILFQNTDKFSAPKLLDLITKIE